MGQAGVHNETGGGFLREMTVNRHTVPGHQQARLRQWLLGCPRGRFGARPIFLEETIRGIASPPMARR